jgi:8-oxo-dGTP pyrophosphatase MutT (NUDIX family)
MDRILQGADGWQQWIAHAITAAPRPIHIDPRVVPRDAGGRSTRERFDRSTMAPARAAATLLLLYPGDDGELHLPLTVRHPELRAHAGEISLPGGSIDATDASPADAARREAWEELGVEPDAVSILGELDPIWIPVSNFELRPFVGATPARPAFRPHDREVAEIFELPMRRLLDGATLSVEEIEVRGLVLRAGVYRHAGQRIWGATAFTLAMFAAVISGTTDGPLEPRAS